MTQELQKGTTLKNGKYVIDQVLGRGGFGITYKALMHTTITGPLGKINTVATVAIKEFYFADACQRHTDGKNVLITSSSKKLLTQRLKEKFLREAYILARLQHPHIVQVLEIFQENNTAYMVMQYIDGPSLATRVQQSLSVKDSVCLIKQVLRALDFVHQNKTLHLDVKPQNILCTKEDQAILIDFGIAKHYDEEGQATSTVLAAKSAGFSPLEQYGAVNLQTFSPAIDIYAVGATLYFCLTGRVPVEAHLRAIGETMLEPMELNAAVPRQLNAIVMKAMELNRSKRFSSCQDMLHALEQVSFEQEEAKEEKTLISPTVPTQVSEKAYQSEKHEQQEVGSIFASDAKTNGERCLCTLEGHTDVVRSVAFSPNGRYALSGSDDNTLKLWDTTTGECFKTIEGHMWEVYSVAFSPDGRRVLSGSKNGDLKLWDPIAGKCLNTMKEHQGAIYSVAFSPDGQYALSGGTDETLKLWDLTTEKCIKTIESHGGVVYSAAFSPDGRYALSGSLDNTLRLWEIATGQCIKILEGHRWWVYSVAFSPDGRYALSGSYDNTLKLWDLIIGKCLTTMEDHGGVVYSVAFSPNGRYALSGSADTTLKLWDLQTGQCLKTMEGHGGTVYAVAFSFDGCYALSGSGDNTLKLWDMREWAEK
ncbi:MAG: serine/threonine-protein kinase [Cytophagales bacterium]|nr:serine/threonine protein kinase [Bernardetiaceae bacterium]MDW8210425.1 serine/threonine-protein kinase [Cytophagales bacterium]